MIISSVVSAASRLIRSLAILFLLAPQTVFADFCSVDNFGNVTSCFPSADMCQQWARTSQGRCVLRQSGGTPAGGGARQGGDWLGNLNQTLGGIAERQRAAIKDAKANTPDYLLPLSTPSQPTSRETNAIIESTLKTALEMEPGQALKEWANPAKGSKGFVAVEAGVKNQFGDICREFFITLDYSSERRGVKGNACRSGGTWRILGSVPLEFRDGKIVDSSQPPQSTPSGGTASHRSRFPTKLAAYSATVSPSGLIKVAGKIWTRCLVGQHWDSPEKGKCNESNSLVPFESRMKLIDFSPEELRGEGWRIPTRRELQDFFKELKSTGRLTEIGETDSNCEWSNDAHNEKLAYAREWNADPQSRLNISTRTKLKQCGVRLVSDSIMTASNVGKVCVSDSQCSAGLYCIKEKCGQQLDSGAPCERNTECSGSLVCVKGACIVKPTNRELLLGAKVDRPVGKVGLKVEEIAGKEMGKEWRRLLVSSIQGALMRDFDKQIVKPLKAIQHDFFGVIRAEPAYVMGDQKCRRFDVQIDVLEERWKANGESCRSLPNYWLTAPIRENDIGHLEFILEK